MRILRGQLEAYIAERFGRRQLGNLKNQGELRKIKREIGSLKRKLAALELRRAELEKAVGKQ